MRRIVPLLGLLVVACAAGGGSWPSLARRPGEVSPMVPRPAAGRQPAEVAVAAPDASSAPAQAAPPVAINDITARLSTIGRDLDDVAARLKAQRAAVEMATRAARGAADASDARGTVELETTRLERIGGQVADLRDRLDAIAGTLADAAASGADVAAPIRMTGGLIARTRALDAEFKAAMPAASGARPG